MPDGNTRTLPERRGYHTRADMDGETLDYAALRALWTPLLYQLSAVRQTANAACHTAERIDRATGAHDLADIAQALEYLVKDAEQSLADLERAQSVDHSEPPASVQAARDRASHEARSL